MCGVNWSLILFLQSFQVFLDVCRFILLLAARYWWLLNIVIKRKDHIVLIVQAFIHTLGRHRIYVLAAITILIGWIVDVETSTAVLAAI